MSPVTWSHLPFVLIALSGVIVRFTSRHHRSGAVINPVKTHPDVVIHAVASRNKGNAEVHKIGGKELQAPARAS